MYRDFALRIWEKVLGLDDLERLPKMLWEESSSDVLTVSISLVCLHRENVSKFFYDMISRWLIPETQLEMKMNFSTHLFQGGVDYSVSEVLIGFKNVDRLARAKHNFPFLEKEIMIGAKSIYHATKILEMKGMTLDDKTARVQEMIARMVSRFPTQFDYDIFPQMQRFMVASGEGFKAVRQPAEMARIVFTLYRFRKLLAFKVESAPTKRHLRLKLKRTMLHTPFGLKEVVSVYIGINFLREHELFEERHLLSALSKLLPGVQTIPSSYYSSGGEDETINTFYMEVEKENRQLFTPSELLRLKKELSNEIGKRIEQLVPPIFMPRNEEEVMRNILTLSNQLRYLRDIPQMMISFDDQTDTELSFTVILARILQAESLSILELFQKGKLRRNVSIDRVKVVGQLRRKYPKEACVLRVRLPVEDFYREDYSVDLFQARISLVKEIENAIGEVRDYNGGMIEKQNENFLQLKQEIGIKAQKHTLLLQNYFHSIFPASLSSTADPKILEILFGMLLGAIESKETVSLKSKRANDDLFVLLKFQDFSIKQKIYHQIESLKLPSNELLSVQVQVLDSFYLGFIYLNPTKEKQSLFLEAIPDALLTFQQKTPY